MNYFADTNIFVGFSVIHDEWHEQCKKVITADENQIFWSNLVKKEYEDKLQDIINSVEFFIKKVKYLLKNNQRTFRNYNDFERFILSNTRQITLNNFKKITILENFWNKFNLSYEVPSVIYEKFRNYYDGFEKIYFARDDYLNRTIHFHDCGMDNYKRYLNYAEYLGFYGIHNPDCKIITDAHDCGLKHDNLKFVSNDKEMIREINSLKISFPVIIEFKSLN